MQPRLQFQREAGSKNQAKFVRPRPIQTRRKSAGNTDGIERVPECLHVSVGPDVSGVPIAKRLIFQVTQIEHPPRCPLPRRRTPQPSPGSLSLCHPLARPCHQPSQLPAASWDHWQPSVRQLRRRAWDTASTRGGAHRTGGGISCGAVPGRAGVGSGYARTSVAVGRGGHLARP